jgi:AAA family ATP:ADP antiporter
VHEKLKNILLNTLFLGVKTNPGERKGITGLFISLFLILMTTYFLKPAREILILTENTAEIKSYAVAMQAILLIIILPIYGRFSRKYSCNSFMRSMLILFSIILAGFFIAAYLGLHISVVFYVWLGVYSVLVIAQFWAFATDLFTREAGERLFVIIAFGGSIGAWAGSVISRVLVNFMSAQGLILLSAVTLAISIIPVMYAVKTLPPECILLDDCNPIQYMKTSFLACFQIVLTRRLLLMIALFIILFNLINSTGEYLLSSTLERDFREGVNAGLISIEKSVYVGKFYSSFYFIVNLAGAIIQFFLVSRVLRITGFNWAFALTPLVVVLGYGSLFFFPVLAFLRLVKISENSLDYSLLNTTRQMLYLPLSRQEKYEARATIDSFGQRVGDLLQAGVVFVGLNIFQFVYKGFISVVVVFAIINVILAYFILRERGRLIK